MHHKATLAAADAGAALHTAECLQPCRAQTGRPVHAYFFCQSRIARLRHPDRAARKASPSTRFAVGLDDWPPGSPNPAALQIA